MHNNIIQIFEHQPLRLHTVHNGVEFKREHLELLEKFRGDKDDTEFPYYTLINRGVKFKQYIGVLCVGDLQIEVLPKADRIEGNEDTWKGHLLDMLKVVYKLKVKAPSAANQELKRTTDILDVFIQKFLDEVEMLLHRGIVKTYRKVEDNCKALKGKLLFSKHITKNCVHQERFYVNFTTYDRNHVMNRILYKALRLIPDITNNSYTKNRAIALTFNFPELLDINITESTFAKLDFNRKTEDYRTSMVLARLLLMHYMPNLTSNKKDRVLALMFDMNKLWEEYVYLTLKKEMLGEYTVISQNQRYFWTGETGMKTIRPDIVVKKRNEADDKKEFTNVIVLDTKWKCPKEGKPSDADLKQMYVYHKYWHTKKTALLYPGNGQSQDVDGSFYQGTTEDKEEGKLFCSMIFLPLFNLADKPEEAFNAIKDLITRDVNTDTISEKK